MRWLVPVLGAVWLMAVVSGMGLLQNYEETPGQPSVLAKDWPASSQIKRQADRATLVVLAHPRCPCTAATVRELARLMARCGSRLTAEVLFYRPKGAAAGWEKTDLYARAAAIPGVHVFADEDCEEARRFHAATSGQVLLFDANGRLMFSGGITSGRGHEGDCAGQAAIIDAVNNGVVTINRTPVFGCSLAETASP